MNFPSNQFFELFKNTYGALSCCESIALYNIVQQAPEGIYIELGSHKGKSGIVFASALKDGKLFLVDPIFEDYELASEVRELVLSCARNDLKVVYLAEYSTDIIERFDKLAFVFLDSGSHQDGLPMKEVKMLEDRIMPGGILAFHDYNCQFIEVTEAYNYLISTGKYEPIEIDWDKIINYAREHNLEANNKSWHHVDKDFPCFVGALKRI